jgi:hypothetical protein
MRLSVKIIAVAAFAVLLVPAFNLFASEVASPSTGAAKDEKAVDSSVAVVSDPIAALPSAPMPMDSSAAAMPYSRGLNTFTPRVEWFMGYTYLRAVPQLAEGNRLVYLNGGSTSLAFNFNRYFGIVGDFGGFNDTRLLLTGGNLSQNDQIDKGRSSPFSAVPDFLSASTTGSRHLCRSWLEARAPARSQSRAVWPTVCCCPRSMYLP